MKQHSIHKPILLALAISSSLISSMSVAQSTDREPCDKAKGPHKILEVLEISDDQKSEFLEVMNTQHEKRRALHNQQSELRAKNHDAMKALHQETLGKLEPILTEHQLEEFEAFAKKNRPRKNMRRPLSNEGL